MAKRKTEFWESALMNNRSFLQYYNRLTEIALSRFEWVNLPSTVDQRFLELALYGDGMAVFFYDDVLGYLALQCMIGGRLNVYRIPIDRTAYASNGYNMKLDDSNSVIIFNNYLHTNSIIDIEMFSRRLYNLDRAIDVNANAQKTPILLECEQNQKLTMQNLYKEYDGNAPVIRGYKGLDTNGLRVLKTDAPYVADKLYDLKTNIWNEALTYLGVSNVAITKKERLITDEVNRSQGGTVASRYSPLQARREACDKINNMFGLDIWVNFREDVSMDWGDSYE